MTLLLEAQNIRVCFRKENQSKIFGKEEKEVLKSVSFAIKAGECLGLVGESGSGKSTLGRVISGLERPASGTVRLNGQDLYLKGRVNPAVQHLISIVFQDYYSSVNPRFRIFDVLMEALRVGEKDLPKTHRKQRCLELLDQVGLDATFLRRYPHELSGGQLQRVCIARAVAVKPQLIILDEAISSLDAATQTQVMDLLLALQKEFGFSYLFITHDLTAVTYMSQRLLFFQWGEIVEEADTLTGLGQIKSQYGQALLAAVMGADEKLLMASVER